jgi:hypothetical protein
MPTIDTNYTPRTEYKTEVRNDTPLTHDEVKARILEVQTQNIQAIENGLEQNSAGLGDRVKIKLPADAQGNPIHNPTLQDWENAAKNNRFVEVEDSPAQLASNFFGLKLVDFGNTEDNKLANKILIKELRDAGAKGITFPSSQSIPASPEGDIIRAFQAKQDAIREVQEGLNNPSGDGLIKAKYLEIKVPADAQGNPIKNPSMQDWVDAQKNNRWAQASGYSHKLAADYFGANLAHQIETIAGTFISGSGVKEIHSVLNQVSKNDVKSFIDNIRLKTEILAIPDAGKILEEVFKVLGPAYNSELSKANDLREQMDSLRKKNDALQKLENSISGGNTAGSNPVDFDVPTKRYVYDSEGNKVLDSDGKPKTEAITHPASEEDWARAAEWKSIKELEGKDINGRDAANKYLGIQLSHTSGDNAHNINLSNNIQKIGNARTAVQSEMTKLSGQFDFRMGNAQTNLQNANKIISNINDMLQGIARSI